MDIGRTFVTEPKSNFPTKDRQRRVHFLKIAQKQASFQTNQRLKDRNWVSLQHKIRYPTPSPDSYSHTPFGPGLSFWQAVLAPITPSVTVDVPIPDSLLMLDGCIWASWETDKIVKRQDFRLTDFLHSLNRGINKENRPIAVLRVPVEGGNKAIPLNSLELEDKIVKNQLPLVALVQKMLISHNNRPNITRLFYIVREKEENISRGYAISNTSIGYAASYGKFIVNSEVSHGIEGVLLANEAIKPIKRIAKRLVEYLERIYRVRILDICLDFLKDEGGVFWLIGCQGFQMASKSLICPEFAPDLSCCTHCPLCVLPYPPWELQFQLPFRLLHLYITRVTDRLKGKSGFDSERYGAKAGETRDVSVCAICYQLILQEYELHETQTRLAGRLNAGSREEPGVTTHSDFLPVSLPQWRIFLYFADLYGDWPFETSQNVTVAYKFMGIEWKIHLKSTHSRLNFARIHYFFASNSIETLHFCQNLPLFVTISTKNAEISGNCRPFSQIHSILPENSDISQSLNVLLFNSDAYSATLRLIFGLSRDNSRNLHEISTKIHHFGDIFIPESEYFTCDLLPTSWLAALDQSYSQENLKSRVDDSDVELEKCYSPLIDVKKVVFHGNKRRKRHKSAEFRLNTDSVPRFSDGNSEKLKRSRGKRGKYTGRWSESTASSSRVLYMTDSGSRLSCPALISSRPHPSPLVCECPVAVESSSLDLRTLVQHYISQRLGR